MSASTLDRSLDVPRSGGGSYSRVLAAFNADAAVRDPEVGGESWRGRNGVRTWAERWRDALGGLELQTQKFVESDGEVGCSPLRRA